MTPATPTAATRTADRSPMTALRAAPTLVDRLAELAAAQGDAVAVRDRRGETTYASLWARATELAEGPRLGSRVGPSAPSDAPPVLALLPPGASLLATIVGGWAAGRPVLTLDPAGPTALARHLARRVGTGVLVVGDDPTRARWPHPGDGDGDGKRVGPLPTVRPTSRAMFLARPGTPTRPALVSFTHGELLEEADRAASALALGPDSVLAVVGGPWTQAAAVAWLAGLAAGATIAVLDDAAASLHPPADATALVVSSAPAGLGGRTTAGAPVVATLRTAAGEVLAGEPWASALDGTPVAPPASPTPPRRSERAVAALIHADERLVARHHPLPRGAIPVADLPWAAKLDRSWPVIRAELDGLLDDRVQLPRTDDVNGAPQGADGSWTTFVLHAFGRWVAPNVARCPTTSALIAAVPGLEIAGYTVLGPRTHIPSHRGPFRSIRYQLAVRVPPGSGRACLRIGEDVVRWAEGVSAAFDDATRHEAWNDGEAPRYVLFVQCAWPLPGLAGLAHRGLHRRLGRAGQDLAERATALDDALNAR